MKFMKLFSIACTCLFVFNVSNVFAIDKARYIDLVDSTVEQAKKGKVKDIDALIAQQVELIELGIQGSLVYLKTHPEDAAILGEVIANAEKMKAMTLEKIEDQWHQGKHMKSRGFDMHNEDHFGSLYGLMDSIIHPATSYIALQEYKKTKDSQFLDRAMGELIEVALHVKNIEDTELAFSLAN